MLAPGEVLHQHGGIVAAIATGLEVGDEGLDQADGVDEGLGRHLGGTDVADSHGTRSLAVSARPTSARPTGG
ncbi:MAG TPA: hypothetical protein VHZ02_13035 [Acidimicrobiales bacterium]|nr:hypothetical protein [Acidimicrobiales bacterium]